MIDYLLIEMGVKVVLIRLWSTTLFANNSAGQYRSHVVL